jgi:hypothetical protein
MIGLRSAAVLFAFLPVSAGLAQTSADVIVAVDVTEAGRSVPHPSAGHPAYYLPLMEGRWDVEFQAKWVGSNAAPRFERRLAAALAREHYLVMNPARRINAAGQLTYADGAVVTVPEYPDGSHPLILNAAGKMPLTEAMLEAKEGIYSLSPAAPGLDSKPTAAASVLWSVDPIHGAVLERAPSLILAVYSGEAIPDWVTGAARSGIMNENQLLNVIGGRVLDNLTLDFERGPVLQAERLGVYFVVVAAYDFAPYAQSRKKVLLWRANLSIPRPGFIPDDALALLADAGGPYFGWNTALPKVVAVPIVRSGNVQIGAVQFKDFQGALSRLPGEVVPLDQIAGLNGSFHDRQAGLSGYPPDGWVLVGARRPSAGATTIYFRNPRFPAVSTVLYYEIYATPRAPLQDDFKEYLRKSAINKQNERSKMPQFIGYINRDGSYVDRTIGGRPALSWFADFTHGGMPWAEYLTKIYSPAGDYLLFVRGPAETVASLAPAFDGMMKTVRVR